MKRVFETAECEAVRNSIFWELRYKKHKDQMKGCGMELRVRDSQMNAWNSWNSGIREVLSLHCKCNIMDIMGLLYRSPCWFSPVFCWYPMHLPLTQTGTKKNIIIN